MGIFVKDEGAPRSPKVQPYNVIRPLTASAAIIKVNDKTDIQALSERKATQKWQEDAWEYFDAIGEIKYAFNLFANILSRIRIHAAYVENDQDAPTPIRSANVSEATKQAAEDAMQEVFGGGRHAEILRKSGINILVVGECYLISEKIQVGATKKTKWRIVSTDELVAHGKGFALKSRRNKKASELKTLPSDTFMGRIWREHPRYSDEPDSSMRALCDLCNELLLLSRTVRATAKSRLNAGALFVPDEFSVSRETPTDFVEGDDLEPFLEEEHDEFEEELVDSMTTPIADESSASAVVPLLIRGPAELGDKIRLIKFERAFDPQLTNRADRALERILQGIEMPKEMVTGLSNIKYSNAIQINDSFYTAHIEPLVLMLCDVYKTIYLEPALIKAGCDPNEIDRVVIWYDPSGITTAPDKSSAANVGFDKGALSEDAWRRANGFTEDDAPSAEEKAMRIALQRGPVTPQFMDTVLNKIVPELFQATRANTLEQSGAPVPDSVNQLLEGSQAPPSMPGEPLGDGETAAPAGLIEPDSDISEEAPETTQEAPEAEPTEQDSTEEQEEPLAETEQGDWTDGFVEDTNVEPETAPDGDPNDPEVQETDDTLTPEEEEEEKKKNRQ